MRQKLYNAQQAHQVLSKLWPRIKSALMAGHELEIEVTSTKRSQDQSAMFHAIIGQIAKQATHVGSKWSTEDWKRLTIHKWAQETGRSGLERVIPALGGGGIVQLGLQSRKFTKEDASEFTEWLLAWAAQNGVEVKHEG